ncbi:MAG TPA: NADPH:quinone oxidoreductase family protein [Burkholderiales bacterium]|nr:NADPH:quinone oxidoreductase family protein [Burkholderiales bacterium]
MRAVLCKRYGPPETLVVEEVASPRPRRGEVVIRVKACGVNFPDTLIIQGRYQFKPALPFSPGSDVCGVIKEVGEGVTGFGVGDRVVGFSLWGGFAEEVALDAARVSTLPQSMDFAAGAALMLVYGTSYYALHDRGALQAGETLLVLGAAGGVGLAAVEIGRALGARVIACASTRDKLELCRRHGAEHLIDYSAEDLRARLDDITGGKGVDVVYDPVGGSYSEPAFRSLAWDGRLLVVGFASGEIARLPLNLPLLKSASVIGVYYGKWVEREPQAARRNLERLFALHAQGRIAPHVSARYPLERAADALNDVLARRILGKAVLEIA